MPDLTNIHTIQKILAEYNLSPNKFLGQNFLIDKNVLEKIIAAAEIAKGENVLEIGPGLGTLTAALLSAGASVLAIEKDKKLSGILADLFVGNKNLKIINTDFLIYGSRTSIGEVGLRVKKVVSNIPYYITSPILRKILSARKKPKLIVLLAQKEVAERICAKAGQMSFISVFTQFYARPEITEIVKPSCFWPKPEVDSAILKIIPRKKVKIPESEERELWQLVKIGFSSRRKTLANNLSAGLSLPKEKVEEVLKSLGFDEKIRAQELDVAGWIGLLQKLNKDK